MPQIIMMCHAAHINHKRMENRVERKRGSVNFDYGFEETPPLRVGTEAEIPIRAPSAHNKDFDPVVANGQKLSELSTDFEKLAKYLNFTI